MASQFAYSDADYTAAMLQLGAASTALPSLTMYGQTLAQTLVGECVSAELFAAQMGVVPYVTLPDGTKGIVNVGGARSVISNPAKWSSQPSGVDPLAVQTLYLASHGAARMVGATAQASSSSTPDINVLSSSPVAGAIGVIPVAVYLTVLGVAAIAAAAWYATSAKQAVVQVDGTNARALSRVDSAVKLAEVSFATTGTIPSQFWDFLEAEATAEKKAGDEPWLIGAGVGAGVLAIGAAAWGTHRAGLWSFR